jgi:hypothetical protein
MQPFCHLPVPYNPRLCHPLAGTTKLLNASRPRAGSSHDRQRRSACEASLKKGAAALQAMMSKDPSRPPSAACDASADVSADVRDG